MLKNCKIHFFFAVEPMAGFEPANSGFAYHPLNHLSTSAFVLQTLAYPLGHGSLFISTLQMY